MDIKQFMLMNTKPRIRKFATNRINITRAGISHNPLQRYSFTGGDVFKIDDLVTTKGTIIETAKSKIYDFAQANVPMKFYVQSMLSTALLEPTNVGWSNSTDEALLNKLKVQDNTVHTSVSNTNTLIRAMLVELDLTELATQLGGNAKLKEAFAGIAVDAWSKGSGANTGVLTNGSKGYLWSGVGWDNAAGMTNTTSSIAKGSAGGTGNSFNIYIGSNNKVFVLIASQYASDGTIPSSISLDYISIKLDYKERTVTKDGSFFVGGDSADYNFDFGLKVAGSVVECPMRIWYSAGEVSPTLASFTSEVTDQPGIDKLKSQESTALPFATSSNGKYAQLMLELDLTPLCNQLFGGSNSALKAALKNITADVWAMGSGSNGGVATNGVNVQLWYDNIAWSSPTSNLTSAIAKITMPSTQQIQSWYANKVNTSNKLYLLIASQYPSDGTISSSVSLDYLNIKIDLARTPDTVQPIQVNLPKYWAKVVRGWSPCYDNTKVDKLYTIMHLEKDSNNLLRISWNIDGKFQVMIKSNGTTYLSASTVQTFSKNQLYNIMVVCSASAINVFLLKNNGTVEKVISTLVNTLNGIYQFNILNQGNTQQAYAFAESFHLIDLQRIGKSAGFTDAEAEILLRGIPVPSENELVVNGDFSNGGTGWTTGLGTWNYGSGKAVSSSTIAGDYIYQDIQCVPNSQYILFIGENIGRIYVEYRDGAGARISDSSYIQNIGGTINLITPSNCYKIRVRFGSYTNGANVSFDNISLKYVKPQGAIALPNTELFDINKVTLHANAVRSNGVITLNATDWYQSSTLNIPVLPNNKYVLNGKTTKTASQVQIQAVQMYGNITIDNSVRLIDLANGSIEFTTKPNVNIVQIKLFSTVTGTFTFSNISLKLKM